MSASVNQDDLKKALAALTDLAKSAGQTADTKPVAQTGESGDTHVAKFSGDSNPGSWAGSKEEEIAQNGATDSIADNGTDYKGKSAKMMKSVLEKLSRGQALTPQEFAIVKGKMDLPPLGDEEEDAPPVAKAQKHADEEQDKELINEMMGKSLSDHAREHSEVRKGLEVSQFLAGWADVMHKSMRSTESRLAQQLQAQQAAQAEFNKSLATAISNLANVLGIQTQRIEQVESAPARAPKSEGVVPITKGSYGGPAGQPINKSQVLKSMVDFVQQGKLDAREVIRYESTGQLRPEVAEALGIRTGS